MSDGDEAASIEGSNNGKPPLPSKTPSKDPSTIITSITNPLGISPPGMRLRSGKKKKPKPRRDGDPTRSNKKRRRGDEDDDSDTGTEGSENSDMMAPRASKRSRALELEPTIPEAEEIEGKEGRINETVAVILDQDGDAQMNDTEKDVAGNLDENANADMDMDNVDYDSIAAAVNATLEKEAGSTDDALVDLEEKSKESHQETRNAIASINSVSSPPTVQFATIDGLRLPSQHTPAPRKLDATYGGKNKMKDFMTPAKGLAEKETDTGQTGKNGIGSSMNSDGSDSEVASMNLKMTNGAELSQEEGERDEGRKDGLSHLLEKQGSSSRRTAILVTMLVCLHMILALGTGRVFFTILPFTMWSNFSDVAGRKVTFYRDLGVFSTPPVPPMPKPEEIEQIELDVIYTDNQELAEKEEELIRQRMVIEWWKEEKKSATELNSYATELIESTQFPSEARYILLSEHRNAFKLKEDEIAEWNNALNRGIEALQLLKEGFESPEDLDIILRDLVYASRNYISSNDLHMISLTDVSIPGEGCSGSFVLQTEETDVVYATEEDLANAKSEIEDYVTSTYSDIQFDASLFKPISDWIEKELEKNGALLNLDTPPDLEDIQIQIPEEKESAEIPSIDINDVKEMIHKKVEVMKADRLAKHDYASIRAGASVIYNGPRQTSPSLVENLPLGNQLMASLGLRFYGYGPETALEPTFPADSLGQCWSFEKEGERKRVTIKEWAGEQETKDKEYRGEYATLAVKLGEPAYVQSIVIEHAPLAVSKTRDTAIRTFRIIGFQEDDASGEPWHLGTAVYNAHKLSLQEFEMNSRLENGVLIPMMESVVLAIDSNWDADYSCLYRFRVHGKQ
eukprot:scaffold2686_cov267-Chaetoceros_neogracile.AAC.11